MIIFGFRGVTTTPEKGDFHCPSCSTLQQYALKRVRRFFTLYFIPVIPLNRLGEYVECRTCKDTYKPVVLEYDPEKQAQAVQAEYHLAVEKIMIHVLLADGHIDDAEVAIAVDTYQKITGAELESNVFRQRISEIQSSGEDLAECLMRLQGSLNDEGKELAVKAALHVALADGEFQQEEQDLVAQIGANLGMTPAHVQGVISTFAG
jgi:uncharacterized tellurite resistance protein B-like protein